MIAAALALGVAAVIAPLPHTRTGDKPRALVLVHGLGGDRHVWDDVAPELAKSFTIITVDLPGHGEAPAPKTFDADEIAARIKATADREGFGPRQRILVGHSLGGYIVAHAHEPSVFVDIGVGKLFEPKELDELRANLKSDREAALRGWFGPICKPAQLERLLVGLRKLSNETLLGYAKLMGTQPTPSEKVGGMLMASKLILPGKRPQAEELAAVGFDGSGKNLRVEHFDASMHWVQWDEPQKFVATLLDFARAWLK